MANDNSNSDPNLHIPLSPPNEIVPVLPKSSLQIALSPSYNHKPRKKRTKKFASSSGSSTSKPKYTIKPDPNAPKIPPTCTECGKQFWSLKALFGHMRCHPERQWRGIIPPPNDRNPTVASSSKHHQRSPNWVSCMFKEDHEVASCLLMLSNGTPSKPERFECGGCKKVFGSHQALGGHRASHKNVKGCFAITNVTEDHMTVSTSSGHQDHKCGICFLVFSSAQALRGHMRCHLERDEETVIGGSLDLNVPATIGSCSLDLRLGL